MTSRRPMTRSFSGNGRTSSFSEEESSSSNGRTESRNTYLSNVRPENSYSRYSHYRPTRSTLCSVMAQLTEDTQPSFETTLKSKAVSEKCNVKFTCVVSGYPAPELKWYKDDMEMDRYCGLPKYEIHRNGKTHILHIYNCTLDDAAIYQVSASNSKGIVSCSGVLEVGTMNEFKIHQRFFAKLKQKAEKKKKDMDGQTKNKDKENTQKEKPQKTPEPPQRKRSVPPPEELAVVKESVAVEQLGAAAEPNGISSGVKDTAPLTSMDSSLENEVSPSEETLAKKRIKMSNGVDAGVNSSSSSSSSRSHVIGNGGENCYDGGISLAQFLSETLQSQAAEENQNSSRVENPKEMDTVIVSANKEKERDQEKVRKKREEQEKALQEEKEKRREEESAIEREEERERQLEVFHTTAHGKHGSEVKHHSKGHKDHDHHNIQASISSMLHTVKDFFFGKNKKDFNDYSENEEREFDHAHASVQPPPEQRPDIPPSFRLQMEHNPEVCRPFTEGVVSMEVDKPEEPIKTVHIEQQSVSPEPHKLKYKDSVLHTDLLPAHKFPPESVKDSTGHSVMEADNVAEVMELSVSLSGLQVPPEAEKKDSEVVLAIKKDPMHQQQTDSLVVSPQSNHQAVRDESSSREDKSVLPLTQASADEECAPTSTPTSLEECRTPPHSVISAADNHSHGEAPTKMQEQMSVDDMDKEGEPDTQEGCSSTKLCEEEKAEVKSKKQPCLDINRSEITELSRFSLENRIVPRKSKTPDQVLSAFTAVVACSVERGHAGEDTKCTSPIQEMNVGFPHTAVPESLEAGDLKMQHECTPSIAEEITEVNSINAIQSSNSSSEEKSEIKEGGDFTLEKDLESNLCNSLETREQMVLEGESCQLTNESLQFEVKEEKKTPVNKDNLDESKIRSDTQSKGSNTNVLEEHSTVKGYQDGSESGWSGEHGWLSDNIPPIQISTIEDIPDIKTTVPDVSPNEQFIIPKIEIMEPELKECTLPLIILALNKPEPANSQKRDVTHESKIIIQDRSAVDPPALLPTQEGMQNDYHISLTEKVKEVAQLNDKTKTVEPPHGQSSEQLPQMNYASIPVINVSCSDDKEGDGFVNTHVSHTQQAFETPRVPLFVVPPISVTCHESDPELRQPTKREWTETETLAVTQKGTKYDADNTMTMMPRKTQSTRQDVEEMSEKNIKENTPTILYEALLPKVVDNVPSISRTTEENVVNEILKPKSLKDTKTENSVSVEDLLKNRSSVERLTCKPPTHPSLSPASLRKFMSKAAPDSDNEAGTTVPVITVGDRQSDKGDEDLSGGSTPTSSLSCESSPRLKRRDSLTLIRSATPEELASGARRKIFILKPKEDVEGAVIGALDTQGKKETPYMSPSQARRAALLQAPTGQNTPPMERRSPLPSRRRATLEVPKVVEETPAEEPASTKPEEKPAEKKIDPLKAPQVIRKIRGEPFPDASGHLKLWCQFFNVLTDSTIKWFRDEEEILEIKRSGGDESQVALAIVLASRQDCGVYGCTINNEYGTDTTDFLLSIDILSEILLKDDLEVGEEMEMTPLLFTKGLANCGNWGDKYFGRIMTETVHIGEGCAHKASRVKVIYGLDPVFESGSTCIIKVQNPIAYGTKQESNLAERNLEITKQECKVQNMIREYCKIFAAEARVIENFGCSLEVIPQYLMYRPANSVPYATVEADLSGVFLKYSTMDLKGKLITQNVSEVEQKCITFQHWIHQWTHGNLLVTQLEGVETKITNVRVVTKSKGYQGLTEQGSPEVFEQFLTHHQCNYHCGLLGLRPLKSMDSLQQPTKMKGSRSPLLNRKLGSSSPQLQRKGHSPQMSRKGNFSPKVTKKIQETEDNKSSTKPAETLHVLEMR
ncbi:alpha-protein kinase 3 isoform X1 [Embiotoca jacksoni]|uniref:alpha-protein kinase 3 isoform X1 n=1 Tax=Embiotoca jacksoni TaxID=100190 RepID=UPI0037039827